MKRVMVIGCPGAGKSTLAKALAERTGLPLIHLDQEYWSKGWTPMPKVQWIDRLKQICSQPRWILDGNYNGSIPARLRFADTVVLVDQPRWRCIFNVLRRTLGSLGRVRSDMADGCPERLNLSFLKFIWDFQANFDAQIAPRLQEASASGKRVITVRTRRDMLALIDAAAQDDKLSEPNQPAEADLESRRATP